VIATPAPVFSRHVSRAATLFGSAISFVVGVDLVRAIRPALLLDPEPSWAIVRFLLWIGVASAAASAGVLGATTLILWSRVDVSHAPLQPLPFGRRTLAAIAVTAVLLGGALRFVALERLPASLWIDDVSLIPAALALEGSPKDFADSVRPHPFGVAKPFGAVGVLYLEIDRLALHLFGVTVFGVRFPFAFAGLLSLVTGALLGRALLPKGGGTLVALILAGLRWHLILSRWSYAIVIAPLVDVATLLLLRARRRRSDPSALLAGVTAGLAAHVYLSAWIAAAALLAFAAWPSGESRTPRIRVPLLFTAGFLIAVLPLFVFREGRTASYFARTADHNLRLEIERTRSWMPPFAAAADAMAAPWFLSDPIARHDLAGRSRLGLLGIPLALGLLRALLLPREDLSALLLAHAGAAVAANVTGGQADLPNGMRFAYLMSVTAVAIAAGLLSLLRLARPPRRVLALSLVGIAIVSSGLGARDALVTWAQGRAAFDGFGGEDTLLGRAACRWASYGRVELDPRVGHYELTIEGVRRYRLDPDRNTGSSLATGFDARNGRRFRIVPPGSPRREDERLVERIADAWGRQWGWVYGRTTGSNTP
jgi:dolichyl-phosphate-mannose-protein mannosyltransferase